MSVLKKMALTNINGIWVNVERYKKVMAKNLLEHLLRKAGNDLADLQIARFWKIPEELEKTPCDFIGHTVHGRAILIEAKKLNKTSLPIACRPGLAPHQYVALHEANKADCISLVCWQRGNICATISFDMVIALSEGRQSVAWMDIPKQYLRAMDDDNAHLHLLDHWLPIHAHS